MALWDVIKCADRDGSLDCNIINEEYNDIISLIKKYNPDYKRDVKEYVDKMAKKVNKMNENMM